MGEVDVRNIEIRNPKRKHSENGNFYPYYAGFSQEFANSLINSLKLENGSIIADPWNGSGTTVIAGAKNGYKTVGIDLNPVMVIASKANMVGFNEQSSLWPIALEISETAKSCRSKSIFKHEPLCAWLTNRSASYVRNIERSIQRLLVDRLEYRDLSNEREVVGNISSVASFYYVALFRTVRLIIDSFKTSNPTWIKVAKSEADLIDISKGKVIDSFKAQVKQMIVARKEFFKSNEYTSLDSEILVGSSIDIPINDSYLDCVLTSPPYCTRIDYAVATMPELAVLGFSSNEFDNLRRELIGNSKVPSSLPETKMEWGKECNMFLEKMYNHESKASKSYYFKNHIQYFDSMHKSISELGRVIKPGGVSILVVQDSYYKNLHNDLAQICEEMSVNSGFELSRRDDFNISRTMAGINAEVKKYRRKIETTESVLCFVKK